FCPDPENCRDHTEGADRNRARLERVLYSRTVVVTHRPIDRERHEPHDRGRDQEERFLECEEVDERHRYHFPETLRSVRVEGCFPLASRRSHSGTLAFRRQLARSNTRIPMLGRICRLWKGEG